MRDQVQYPTPRYKAPDAARWLWARLRLEAGFSLVEELVALGLVSLGLVLLVAMITTGSIGVTTTGDKTTADTLARSQLEIIKAATYTVPGSDINPYPTVSASAPYSVSVEIDYWYWEEAEASGTFVDAPNSEGMQRVTVTVSRDGDDLITLSEYKVDR
ncbi:MAG: hypothetical protein ACLFWD_02300 [Anaerolineales bacterium]